MVLEYLNVHIVKKQKFNLLNLKVKLALFNDLLNCRKEFRKQKRGRKKKINSKEPIVSGKVSPKEKQKGPVGWITSLERTR